MKLDRNINKDGHGKYALINLRTNMVEWGGPGGGFFVIKLRDKFAPDALRAYAKAVLEESKIGNFGEMTTSPNHGTNASFTGGDQADIERAQSLREYASEIFRLVDIAENLPNRKLPD